MSAKPTHVANYYSNNFSVNDPHLVSWHLTYVDMTRISHFSKVTKSNQWIVKNAAMNEIAQLYIFSCFLIIQQRYWYRPPNPGHPVGPKTGTDTSSRDVATEWSLSVKTTVRLLSHYILGQKKRGNNLTIIFWQHGIIFVYIMNFEFTTDLVFLTCRLGVHRLTDES